jgi:general nucleoside transport system ATP-binding protein
MKVEIKNIKKYFGDVKANDDISLLFEPGKIYGLLGENGAGKSTLMKILSGFQAQDSGEILLDDKATIFSSPLDALQKGVGMLYQEPLDFPPFTVIENFALGMDSKLKIDFEKLRKDVSTLLDKYQFSLSLDEKIDRLEMGERQQLELVRLLAGGADLLILDEPTTGISGDQKEILFSSLRKLAKEDNKTLILVSHKLAEVQDLCDHAYILQKGKYVGEKSIPCNNQELVELMFPSIPPKILRKSKVQADSMLEFSDVDIETYRLSIRNINLSVKKGEIFGLAGLEGSGQGILLKGCAGLLPIEKGKYLLDGNKHTHRDYHQSLASGIAYVPAGRTEEGLVQELTLTEHMLLSQEDKTFFLDHPKMEALTKERIAHYNVVGTSESFPENLSGGNQQRFLFALQKENVNLMLLEQPTRGLDVISTNWIWEQLNLRREQGTAVIFISPDLDEIIERSDRIAVFSGGEMSQIIEAKSTNADELGLLIGGTNV